MRLKGQRHCAGTSCGPITPFIKTSRGIYNKGVGAILSHPSIYSLSPSAPVVAAGVMDDITQQGFGRRYYHGTGISMEPCRLPCRAIDSGLLRDPNLLKGPPGRRSYSMVQAPGINSDRGPVLNHPDSSPAASPPRTDSPLPPLPLSVTKHWLNRDVPSLSLS